MDKQRLEAYRSNLAEIKELNRKLDDLTGSESLIGNSVIMDYRRGYPQPQSVIGYDYELESSRRERWEKRKAKLQAEVNEVEEWIEAIPDGLTRRCFRMVYCDGLTHSKVGKKLHMDRSSVSKKIDKFLQLSPNSQNSHL